MKLRNLEHKIEFITHGSRSDGAGGTVPHTKVALKTFASIEQLQVSKSIEQAQAIFPATFRVRILFRKGFTLTEKYRVKWGGEIYNVISSPQVDHTKRSLFLVFDMQK